MRLKKTLQFAVALIAISTLFTACFHEDNKINTTCFDEILNQEEEFIDCGGPNCDACLPTCDNGILDYVDGWHESGIDCGGPCETCCENGKWDVNPIEPSLSEEWVDCGGVECDPCVACNNGVHDDGEETTIGGILFETIDCDDNPSTECPPCAELCDDGLFNGAEGPCADCAGACEPCDFSHCENGVLDTFADYPEQNETEIDCGGCGCPTCDLLCIDGILNGAEEAIDCGGGVCVECTDIILCGDGVQNGYETGIDCYDGEDNLSACEPCISLCTDGILNGNETDSGATGGCGGPDCPPCASEGQNFMTYTVTTDTESGVFYESQNATIIKAFTGGDLSDPLDHDMIAFQGGAAHILQFIIEDFDLTDGSMTSGPYIMDNEAVTLGLPNNVILLTNDGLTYQSKLSPVGITFSSLEIIVTGFNTTMETVTVAGSFTGTLSDGLGGNCVITNGAFSIIL